MFYQQNPSLKDFKIYKSFVVLAILGRMAEADSLMSRGLNKRAVYRVAAELAKTLPTPLNPLYRGLLLEPPVNPKISTAYQKNSFVSFSEDFEVGCWFARPDTLISQEYLKKYPKKVTGWVATYTPKNALEFLFHWKWEDYLNQDYPNLFEVAENLAVQNGMDPADWIQQIHWNLKTQKEVMLHPGPELVLVAVDSAGCPVAPILDKKFTQRPDWILAPAGLEKLGISAGQKLYLSDIRLPAPPENCPICSQPAIETIYQLKESRLEVMICSQCGMRSFTTKA